MPLRYGRVDGHVACEALGFPRFKLRQDIPVAADAAKSALYRDTHHAIGRLTPLSNRRQGTLEITVPAPERDADPSHSPWEGMSGAAVFAGGALVGMISEHHKSDGPGRLAARPVSQWYGLADEQVADLRVLLGLPEQKKLQPVSGGTVQRLFRRTPTWVKWTVAFVVGAAVSFGTLYYVGLQDRPPLTVTVQTQESVVDNGAWLFPGKKLVDENATLSSDDLTKLLAKRSDKVDTYETKTKVTVEGGSHSVSITGMRIKILSRTAPAPGGTLVIDPSQGEDANIKIGFDLDETTPVARKADTEASPIGSRYFDSYSDSVKQGEQLNFGITFYAVTSDVTYDLVLEESVDGKVREQVVTDNGRPFRTRGFAPAYDQVLAGPQGDGWGPADRAKAMDYMCGSCTNPMAAK